MTLTTADPMTTSAGIAPAPPRAAAVVRAFITVPPGGYQHPVLEAAAALATEHRSRAGLHRIVSDPQADDPTVAAAARTARSHAAACAVLIDRIDNWAATELAEGRAGVLHTESLGQLIDRMVTVWMRGQLLADNHLDASDPQVRIASAQLGELGRAYDDLVTDLRLGRRRLPTLQTPTGPAGMA
ncbi:DUF4254 domain-containing protein [Amycolatopsis sp. TRM77291]